jgi:alpha-tubulin suppressor-like RCC1 family protein
MVVWERGRGKYLYKITVGPRNVIAVAAGWYHYMALLEDGSVQAWGVNSYGQCNVPEQLR